MSEASQSDDPRDSKSKRGPKEKPLDPDDPNDNAFELVSVEMLFCVIFFSLALTPPMVLL